MYSKKTITSLPRHRSNSDGLRGEEGRKGLEVRDVRETHLHGVLLDMAFHFVHIFPLSKFLLVILLEKQETEKEGGKEREKMRLA